MKAVNDYMMQNFDNDDQCQKYAEWALKNSNFLWHDNEVTWDNKKSEYKVRIHAPICLNVVPIDTQLKEGLKLKGLWLNEIFLRTFGSHFTQISGARIIEALGNPKTLHPFGAAGLCTVSVSSLLGCASNIS